MEQKSKLGFRIACCGLIIALLSIVPGVADRQILPWPLLLGSAVYLAGGLLLAINARGANGKKAMFWLRMVRFGFIAIVAFMVFRLGPPR